MELVAIGILAIACLSAAVGCVAYNNSKENTAAQSSSSKVSAQSNEKGLLDELTDKIEELKREAIVGLAFLAAKIYISNKMEEEAAKKNIEDSFSSAGTRLGDMLGRTINDIASTTDITKDISNDISNDIISGVQECTDSLQESSSSSVVDNFWAPEKEGMPIIDGIPAIPKEGPTILDTPASDIISSPIIDFPTPVKDDPVIIDFPADTGLDEPGVTIFPKPERLDIDNLILKNDGNSIYNSLPNKGVWPKGNPQDVNERIEFKKKLDDLFGVVGEDVPDGKTTKGRKAYKWAFKDGTVVIWEGHPYDRKKGYPKVHTERHYHIILPDETHLLGFFGKD